MTEPVSLALLKGQADTAAPEDTGLDGPIEQIEDIKKASVKSLEALLTDNDTATPEGWSAMSLADKRKWVLVKFEADAASQDAAEAVGDVATAGAASGSASGSTSSETPPVPPNQEPKTDEPPFEADSPKDAAQAETDKAAKSKGKGKAKAEEPAPAPKPAQEPVKVMADGEVVTGSSTTEAVAEAVAEANATKKKGKKKDTGTALVETKTGEIMEPDILQDIVHEVENMPKETALALVAELSEQTDVAFFRLGGILSLVAANNWWKVDDAGYKTFRDYIEQEHGLEYRKATYWIAIYNALAKSGVPWAKVKEVGWTKLKEIAKVLTVENVDEWVGKAKEVNTLTLHDMVKNESDKEKTAEAGSSGETEKVTTKTFKVHAGQKEVIEAAISKAKQDSGTEFDTVALERICQDYLAGSSEGSMTPAQKLSKLIPGLSLEVVMHIVDENFPDYDFVVDKKDVSAA